MLNDLRTAARQLLRNPGFTIVAIVTMALAIGANTAVLSIADAVLFRPLPYDKPAEVFAIVMRDRKLGRNYGRVSNDYLRALSEQSQTVSSLGRTDASTYLTVVTNGAAENVEAVTVDVDYLRTLGVRPARGRIFDEHDLAPPGRAALLSYAGWQQRFGADAAIVGRSVTLGSKTFDVVGILPAGFIFPTSPSFIAKPVIVTVRAPEPFDPRGGELHPIVRLKPGVARERAQAELNTLSAPISAANPRTTDVVMWLTPVREVLYPAGTPVVQFLLGAASLVLLIGCANLGNMLLARHRRRERDTGIRAALGAGRWQLLRPVLFESLLIGISSALLAVLVTSLTFTALLRQIPTVVYGSAAVGVDRRVFLFALVLGLIGALVFALVPAWRASRADALTLLASRHATGAPRRRLGRPMVALQVALSVVLVFGAAIAARAFVSVLKVPLGFEPDNVLSVRWRVPGSTPIDRRDFMVRELEALRSRPDVVAAGAATVPPLTASAPDEGNRERTGGLRYTFPGYFEAIQIPLVRGRLLDMSDIAEGRAAVASASFARTVLAGREPIGAMFENSSGRQFRVVGVVADVTNSFDSADMPLAYILPADRLGTMSVMVRMKTRRGAALEDIKRQFAALAPSTPVTVDWWSDTISSITAYRNPRFQTIVLTAFAVLALGLTAIGIFGVVAFLVASRTREMGIRLAIGATPRRLVRSTLLQMALPVIAGLAIGVVSTRWLAKLAEAQLFKVDTHDPATLAIAGMTVTVAAFVAAYLPARQAAKIDPLVVLKTD